MKLPALLLFIPALGAAPEACPWMNAATAGGFLGATIRSVGVTRENPSHEDAACVFVAATSQLRISVRTLETPRSVFASQAESCGSNPAPLKAIGNEAVVCEPDKLSAQVVGRVRNRLFTVLVTTTDSAAAATMLRAKARSIAEQVAGFLF